jgi:hypothetical protein
MRIMADRGSNGSFPATDAQRSAGDPLLSFVKAPVAKQCSLKQPATFDGERRREHDASIVGV